MVALRPPANYGPILTRTWPLFPGCKMETRNRRGSPRDCSCIWGGCSGSCGSKPIPLAWRAAVFPSAFPCRASAARRNGRQAWVAFVTKQGRVHRHHGNSYRPSLLFLFFAPLCLIFCRCSLILRFASFWVCSVARFTSPTTRCSP